MKDDVTGIKNVPIALFRNCIQSLTEIENSTPESKINGDTAYADYLINGDTAWRIPRKILAVFNSL